MAALASSSAPAWGPSVEDKLHSFTEFAISKLEANAEGLTDGEGDDYAVPCNPCLIFRLP